MMRFYLLLCCFFISCALQAQVYRSVDEDGNVSFSDEPTDDSQPVEVKELEIIAPLEGPPVQPRKSASEPAAAYASLVITSPQDDESIRNNTGEVDVSVSLVPRLKQGHTLMLYMDGQEHSSGRALTFNLVNVDRGTHQLRVAVVNADGRQEIASPSVTFHLQRFSALH